MPKHPSRLYETFKENPNLQYPYAMNDAERTLYQKMMFALHQYFDLTKYLNDISEYVDEATDERRGYGRGENGGPKGLDAEMTDLLKEKVSNLISASQDMYEKIRSNPKLSKAQKNLLFDIQQNIRMAAKENSVLEMLDPKESVPYMSLHAMSADVIIDVGEDELSEKGGQASTRIAIRYVDENGKFRDGFFTEDEEAGVDVAPYFTNSIEKVPAIKKIYDIMLLGDPKTDPDYSSFLKVAEDIDKNFYGYTPADFIAHLKEYKITDKQKAALEKIDSARTLTEGDIKTFKDVCKEISGLKLRMKQRLAKNFFLEKGYNSNRRNNAMSDMATALGMPHLIAKSIPMTIMKKGEAVHGSFMAHAKGADFEEVNPDSNLMRGKSLEINYDRVVKDASDLMVLDYICLNGDRHQNNMFYIIEKDKDGNPVLNGLQGIDNDLSFGNKIPKDNEAVMKLPPLNEIKYITRQTADMVQRLSEGRIRSILMGNEFSEDEIHACCERLKRMQNYINSGGPTIIENTATKEQYDSLHAQAQTYIPKSESEDIMTCTPVKNIVVLESYYEYKLNRFETSHMTPIEKRTAISERKQKDVKKRIQDGLKNLKRKVYIDDKMTMKSQQKQVGKLHWKLASPGKKDSAEYKDMYEKVKELNKALKLFQESDLKINDIAVPQSAKENLLAEKFKDAQSSIRDYITSIPENPSSRDKKNLSIAQALHTVCTDAANSRERQVNELNTIIRKSMVELNRVSKAHNEAMPGFDKALRKMELEAKLHLGSFVGNCEKPNKADMKLIQEDFARILVANKLVSLNTANKVEYDRLKTNFTEDPEYLDNLVKTVQENDNFKKILKNVNPVNALVDNTTSDIQKLADDMEIFVECGVDVGKYYSQYASSAVR